MKYLKRKLNRHDYSSPTSRLCAVLRRMWVESRGRGVSGICGWFYIVCMHTRQWTGGTSLSFFLSLCRECTITTNPSQYTAQPTPLPQVELTYSQKMVNKSVNYSQSLVFELAISNLWRPNIAQRPNVLKFWVLAREFEFIWFLLAKHDLSEHVATVIGVFAITSCLELCSVVQILLFVTTTQWVHFLREQYLMLK